MTAPRESSGSAATGRESEDSVTWDDEGVCRRPLPDGRELFLRRDLFNWVVGIGPAGKGWYDDDW